MAVGINTIWECRQTATAGNLNGAGFNPENSNFLTDLTTDSNTGNTAAPVVSSASYNFVAGDVGAYVFVQSGSNWLPGWYQIASVAANKATLTATSGVGLWYTAGVNRSIAVSSSAGVASVGTPTGGVWSIDYSQQDASALSLTDLACTTPSTTVTSAAGSFTPAMVGNVLHINSITGTGALVGWYEIVSYTNTTTVVLDRTPAPTNNATSGAFRVGGAASLQTSAGATDDLFFENGAGTNGSGSHWFFVRSGAYTGMGNISLTAAGGTQATIKVFGYSSVRTDGLSANLDSNRPSLSFGTNLLTVGANWQWMNLVLTSASATNTLVTNANCFFIFLKIVNSNITGTRNAVLVTNATTSAFLGCELICYRGNGLSLGGAVANVALIGCYLHHSLTGCNLSTTTGYVVASFCIFESFATAAVSFSGAVTSMPAFLSCTLYGAEDRLGIGFSLAAGGRAISIVNCILYGFVTPISSADPINSSLLGFADLNNNANPVSNFPAGVAGSVANPGFTSMTQRTGTAATTTSGNHLVDGSATFVTWGITPGVDYLYLVSGTGTTNGVFYSILSVDSETQITTGETLTANATADHVWHITQGHNLGIGTNLKGLGFPGTFAGIPTVGYLDMGAAQRQESGSGGGLLTHPGMAGGMRA